MNQFIRTLAFISIALLLFPVSAENGTRVLMLGTGTPVPDSDRAGASVAVISQGKVFVFDAGGGMVQNAIAAREKLGIIELGVKPLDPIGICCLFFTHLHSDHTLDYVELANTLWWHRDAKLRAWGPIGLKSMTEGMYQLMAADIRIRTSGLQPVKHPDLYQVDVTEIDDGVVYEQDGVRIEAFSVPHGDIKPAFGYKITTPDKSIVISGDTSYSEKLLEMSKGVDLLIHEVISDKGLSTRSEFWQKYHKAAHTPTTLLAKLASKALPKKLVIYHALFYGTSEQELLEEIRSHYDGEVVLANDLDIFH